MRYYATASGPRVREAIDAGLLGMIASPACGNRVRPGWAWCADNGCFTATGYPGDEAYLRWLGRRAGYADRCAFATAPDVVADARATLRRSVPMLERIRALGYPAALVLQDGQEHTRVPYDLIDAVFVGGTTAWKLGPAAADLVAEAVSLGKYAHLGRVNSLRRLRHAVAIGCQSVDGTFLTFGPDRNLPTLLRWLRLTHPVEPDHQPAPGSPENPDATTTVTGVPS